MVDGNIIKIIDIDIFQINDIYIVIFILLESFHPIK